MVEAKNKIAYGKEPKVWRASSSVHDSVGITLNQFVAILNVVLMLILGLCLPKGGSGIVSIAGNTPTSVHRGIFSDELGWGASGANTVLETFKEGFSTIIFSLVGICNLSGAAAKEVSILFLSRDSRDTSFD